ncbi:MAG: phytanoyl-CoA dioxygenase family protein [Alphaproteobacteria bacterium]|nr:phytanoyl-CoA dioxygenase family protein [Alphaproteobacteria bacterium]
MLSEAERQAYRRDGFLVVRDFAAAEACDRLVARSYELIDGFDPKSVSVFTTDEQTRTTDAYFLGSGDTVRFFFEAEALDREGKLQVPKRRAINKIGHALHDLDPAFAAFSRDPRLKSIAEDVGLGDARLLQSMVILKPPGIGGEVGAHQDATFLYTDPISVHGFWFALEDATLENGCMWALPGGHRLGLKRRFRRAGDGVVFEELDRAPLPLPPEGYVPLEAPKGTLVLLHGLLPHWSAANRSPQSRVAYSLHVIDGAAHYPADNWLRLGPHMPLRGF